MRTSCGAIHQSILKQLAQQEMRLLSLVVAVRKTISTRMFKGDLSEAVSVALRQLIVANRIHETDGVFSLNEPKDSA